MSEQSPLRQNRTIGNVLKDTANNIFNRTLGRLRSSGVRGDSRVVDTRARWGGRETIDWRVRLSVPSRATQLYETIFDNPNNELLEPLKASRGMFWPLTPSMVIQHSANYDALTQTHSNYPHYAYQNSQVDQMNIVGEFPVQNADDAKHWVATVNFFRTVTKMFFGRTQKLKGSPPPILHLNGYGDHMFTNVPVIVNTFNVELRSGIDYISTRQNLPSSRRIINPNENRQFDQTYAPTLSLISCLVTPIYSRDSVSQFLSLIHI